MRRSIAVVIAIVIFVCLISYGLIKKSTNASSTSTTWDTKADFESNASTTDEATRRSNVNISSSGKISIDDYESDFRSKSDFTISSYSSLSDFSFDSLGNYVVVTSSGSEIYAYKYDSDDTLVIVQTLIYDGSFGAASQRPRIETDIIGNYYIVFRADRNVVATKIDSNLNTVIAPFQVSDNCADSRPDISVSAGGNFLINYAETDGSYHRSKAVKYDKDGNILINEFSVDDSASKSQYYESCSLDTSGNMVFVWEERENIEEYSKEFYRPFMKKIDENGGVVIGKTKVSDQQMEHIFPKIKTDSEDNIYVTWVRVNWWYTPCENTYLKKYDENGEVLIPQTMIYGDMMDYNNWAYGYTAANSYEPSISVNNSGDFCIGWFSYNATREQDVVSEDISKINFQKFEGEGTSSTIQTIETENKLFFEQIKVSTDGSYLLVWQNNRTGVFYGTRIKNNFKNSGAVSKLKADAGSANTYRWEKIRWKTDSLPEGSQVKARVRSADSQNAFDSAEWSPYYTASGTDIADILKPSRYAEIELVLVPNSSGDSPVVDSLSIDYSSGTKRTATWNDNADFNNNNSTVKTPTTKKNISVVNNKTSISLNNSLPGEIQELEEPDPSYYGALMTGAGDVNNDGYNDFLVGDNGNGKAYLYLGSESGLENEPVWTATLEGYEYSLMRIAGSGDVNNDGYDDIVISAGYYPGWPIYNGKVYLYLGGESGPSDIPDWTKVGTNQGLGSDIKFVGDVNNDSYDDIIVGSILSNKAEIYLGNASGLSDESYWTANAEGGNQGFGSRVLSGDYNNDGYIDIVVTAPSYNDPILKTDTGRLYLYNGSESGINTTADYTFEGNPYNNFTNVVSTGDINNDGYDDLITGVPIYSQGPYQGGALYLFKGSATGFLEGPDWSENEGVPKSSRFGQVVDSLGDINNDGCDDFVTCDNKNHDLYLYLGNATNPYLYWIYPQSDTWSSNYVYKAGDINDDGKPEFAASNNAKIKIFSPDQQMGYVSKGLLSGLKIDAGSGNKATWRKLSWSGTNTDDAFIKLRVRSAATEAALTSAEWSQYITATENGLDDGLYSIVKANRWLEIEADLYSRNTTVTPELSSLSVDYYVEDTESSCGQCHQGEMPSDYFNEDLQDNQTILNKCNECHATTYYMGYRGRYNSYYGYFDGYYNQDFSNPNAIKKIHTAHQRDYDDTYQADIICKSCHYGVACTYCHDSVVHVNHAGAGYPGVEETYSNTFGKGTTTTTLACTNEDCHGSMNEKNFVFRPSCSNCHYKDKTNRVDKYIYQEGHGDIDEKHTYSSSCASCHEDKNIADYHDSKGKDCDTCHESSDANIIISIRKNRVKCVSYCHTSYHAGYEEKHFYSGLSSSCSGCHDKDIIEEHKSRDKSCSICHDDTVSASTDCTENCHESFASHNTDNCSKCHSDSYDTCNGCHKDKQNHLGVVICSSCHSNGFEVHHNNDEYKVKDCVKCHSVDHSTGLDNETCLQCHTNVQHKISFSLASNISHRGESQNIDINQQIKDKLYSMLGYNSKNSSVIDKNKIAIIVIALFFGIVFTIGLTKFLRK